MRHFSLVAAAAVALFSVPALAQDAQPAPDTASTSGQGPRAPDGSRAFGLEPYVGVMGGWEQFDNEASRAGIPQVLNANGTVNRRYKLAGGLAQGVVGANVPLGPVFVGVEGNVAKGFSGDIDWEYGGAGRAGFRAGDSGLFYGKVGYQWVNFRDVGNNHDFRSMTYGIGLEVGPKDIGLGGLTHRGGVRLRGEVNTFGNAHSLRPMAGIIAHF